MRRGKARPWWFWLIGLALLLFSGAGLYQLIPFYTWTEAELAEAVPPGYWEIWSEMPPWAEGGYVLGLVGMFVGATLLLPSRTRAWSRPFFVLSMLAFLVQRFWLLALSDLNHPIPPFAPVTLFIPVVADAVAIWLATREVREGRLSAHTPEA